MSLHRLAGAVALALALTAGVAADETQPQNGQPQYGTFGLDLAGADRRTAPGDDFFRYASGTWLDRTEIPADKPGYSLRLAMTDRTEQRLHELMEAASGANKEHAPASLDGKVGAFYRAFMDSATLDKLGAKAIAPQLDAVRKAKSRDELAALMGRDNRDFEGALFNAGIDVDLKDPKRYAVYLGQAGLGLPDRDYYLKDSFAKQKAAYQGYAATLLKLAGWAKAEESAAAVVAFETKIAEAS